MLRAFLLVSRA